ncbi:Hydroxylase/desaturase CTB9 [Cladobotryum mycophilum]|uniref:Hydroxylase/desaturase CTB9 n=1 Tax=Cladobotryum mycophilum TaxID=491253 RepID=A0ABR0SCR3_9HYPO
MTASGDSHEVLASFNYLKWQDIYTTVKPYMTVPASISPADKPATNIIFERGPHQKVRDVRGSECDFNLTDNGFVYNKWQSCMTPADFTNPEKIEKVLLPEFEELIRKEIEGAGQIFFFDWRVRRSDAKEDGKIEGGTKGGRLQAAANFVHVDYSDNSAVKRAKASLLPGQDESPLRGRFQIINVWRPIDGPVEDCPLAVCDWASVDTSKLIKFDTIRETYTGEYMLALYDPALSWCYMSHQTDDEVLLFKSYDSKEGVAKSQYTPPAKPGG